MYNYKEIVDIICQIGQEGEHLHKWIAKAANRYVEEDYSLAAVCIRNIIDIIADEIIKEKNIVYYGDVKINIETNLNIRINSIKEFMPTYIYEAFYKTRLLGNESAHGGFISRDEGEVIVEKIEEILRWYIFNNKKEVKVFNIYKQTQLLDIREREKTYIELEKRYHSILKENSSLYKEKEIIQINLKDLQQQKEQIEKQTYDLKSKENMLFIKEKEELEIKYRNDKKELVKYIEELQQKHKLKISKLEEKAKQELLQAEEKIKLVEEKMIQLENQFEQEKQQLILYGQEQGLIAIDQGKTAQLLKMYSQGFFKRDESESIKDFKNRINTYPRMSFGKAKISMNVLLESSIVPIEIKWNSTSYTNKRLKFYINFEGVIDSSIVTTPTYFEVTGKHIAGNEYAEPDYNTLQIRVGDNDYRIMVLDPIKSMFETREDFLRKAKMIEEMPVAIIRFNSLISDEKCGFYVGNLIQLPGSLINTNVNEEYCFYSKSTDIDVTKDCIVYCNLGVYGENLVCKNLKIKVGKEYISLYKKVLSEKFANNIDIVPLGNYQTNIESTDLGIGFLHIQIQLDNIFMIDTYENVEYFAFLEEEQILPESGKFYGEIEFKDGKYYYKKIFIYNNNKLIRCYQAKIDSLSQVDKESLVGKKFPIGKFEYTSNGFDRITGYCPLNVINWFGWMDNNNDENEFYTYIDKNKNPITGTKGFVYGWCLIDKQNTSGFSKSSISIGDKEYEITPRKLNRLVEETEQEYKNRIEKNIPIGIARFDKDNRDIENNNVRVIIEGQGWYRGVIPVEKEIYAVIKNKKDKNILLKTGNYTVFCKNSTCYAENLLPNEECLTLHIDDIEVELIVVDCNLSTIQNRTYEYFLQLKRICAGIVWSNNKYYNAEAHLLELDIRWKKWCREFVLEFKKAYLIIEPKKAEELFALDIEYNVYILFCRTGVEKVVILINEEEYELRFDALGNMPNINIVNNIIERELEDEEEFICIGTNDNTIFEFEDENIINISINDDTMFEIDEEYKEDIQTVIEEVTNDKYIDIKYPVVNDSSIYIEEQSIDLEEKDKITKEITNSAVLDNIKKDNIRSGNRVKRLIRQLFMGIIVISSGSIILAYQVNKVDRLDIISEEIKGLSNSKNSNEASNNIKDNYIDKVKEDITNEKLVVDQEQVEEVKEEAIKPLEEVKEEAIKPLEEVKEEATKPLEEVKIEVTKPVEEVKEEATKPVEEVKEEATKPVVGVTTEVEALKQTEPIVGDTEKLEDEKNIEVLPEITTKPEEPLVEKLQIKPGTTKYTLIGSYKVVEELRKQGYGTGGFSLNNALTENVFNGRGAVLSTINLTADKSYIQELLEIFPEVSLDSGTVQTVKEGTQNYIFVIGKNEEQILEMIAK